MFEKPDDLDQPTSFTTVVATPLRRSPQQSRLFPRLDSFAGNNALNTSLFLACMNNVNGGSRPHRTALSVALRHLKTLCGEPPPARSGITNSFQNRSPPHLPM